MLLRFGGVRVESTTMARPKNSPKITPQRHGLKPKRHGSVQRSKAMKSVLPSSTLTAAFNHLEPSWREYINYVQISARDGHEDMKRLYEQWLLLPERDRTYTTPERLCELSNVDPGDLVAEVVRQLWKAKNFAAGVITAVAHPKVIAKTVKSALGSSKSAGFDRTNFLKATGFIPQQKPSLFAKEVNFPQLPAGDSPEMPKLLSHEEEIKRLEAADAEALEGEIVGE